MKSDDNPEDQPAPVEARRPHRGRTWFWPFGSRSSAEATDGRADRSTDGARDVRRPGRHGTGPENEPGRRTGSRTGAAISPRPKAGQRPRHAGTSRQVDSFSGMSSSAARVMRREAARLGKVLHPVDDSLQEAPAPPPPSELVSFLRDCGAALTRAGETVANVQDVIVDLGARYGLPDVRAFVVPTGVFVRVGDGPAAVVDFASVENASDLRLDQIDRLYEFLLAVRKNPVDPREGIEELDRIYAMPPRFPAVVRILGYVVMTIAFGLLTQPHVSALTGYALLGLAVGALREYSDRAGRTLSLVLPVIAAVLVTALAYRYSLSLLGESPAKLLIPPLIAFLPGSALTMGTLELATGSILSGASRLIYGVNVLILLAFGITVGTTLVSHPATGAESTGHGLGPWAPWLGVLLLGAGMALNSSARLPTLPWLLLVLVLAKAGQSAGTAAGGALLGAFAGGLTLPPLARLVERWDTAPPAQVMFLPAFLMLVPGALSLNGIGDLLTAHDAGSATQIVTALLTVVAVALGVMVGASAFASPGRTAPRPTPADHPVVE